jgi:hypothetical protein
MWRPKPHRPSRCATVPQYVVRDDLQVIFTTEVERTAAQKE